MRLIKEFFSNVCIFLFVGIICILLWGKISEKELPVTFVNVLTNSMSPTIKAGSLVIVKKVEAKDLLIGDIITFSSRTELLTHRITKIENKKSFVTKGDHNKIEDYSPVLVENIKGKVIWSVPFLGGIGQIIKTPRGTIAFLLTISQLFLTIEIIGVINELAYDKQRSMKKWGES